MINLSVQKLDSDPSSAKAASQSITWEQNGSEDLVITILVWKQMSALP